MGKRKYTLVVQLETQSLFATLTSDMLDYGFSMTFEQSDFKLPSGQFNIYTDKDADLLNAELKIIFDKYNVNYVATLTLVDLEDKEWLSFRV